MRLHAISLLLLSVLGCARDQDAPPGDDTTGTTAPATTGGDDSTGGVDDSGTSGGNECVGADGCYACEPQTSEQLLDRCTEAQCEPFSLTPERLPLLAGDGSLPPIP